MNFSLSCCITLNSIETGSLGMLPAASRLISTVPSHEIRHRQASRSRPVKIIFPRGLECVYRAPKSTGPTVTTKVSYRLFEKISINVNGPFYMRPATSSHNQLFQRLEFSTESSQQMRILMLLHELGRLIKGPDGNWLLPDDGNDDGTRSIQNSKKIEFLCGKQIREIVSTNTGVKLARLEATMNKAPAAEKQSIAKLSQSEKQ